MRLIRPVVIVLVWVNCLVGYGGVSVRANFFNPNGLNKRLTELNQIWSGKDSFRLRSPWWGITGRGVKEVNSVAIGGGGGISFGAGAADSINAKIGSMFGSFEIGYPRWFNGLLLVKPGVDVEAGTWFVFAHSIEPGYANFTRWFLNWELFALPNVELMARITFQTGTFIGFTAKGGYQLPFVGPNWYGSDAPPEFSMKGFVLDLGIMFGRTTPRPFRI